MIEEGADFSEKKKHFHTNFHRKNAEKNAVMLRTKYFHSHFIEKKIISSTGKNREQTIDDY